MRIDNGRYREVVMNWSNITLPLKAGTPISAAGTVANNGNAIGLVPDKVIAQTPMPRSIFILDAGDVDLAEVETLSGLTLSTAAKAAMPAIRFHLATGAVEDYASGNGLPIVTSDDAGKVLAVSEDGAWAPATASGGGGLALLLNRYEGDALGISASYDDIDTALNTGICPVIYDSYTNGGEGAVYYVSSASPVGDTFPYEVIISPFGGGTSITLGALTRSAELGTEV